MAPKATKSKHWREQLKQNPDKFNKYKEEDAKRAKLYRLSLSEEKRERARLLTKERVRKHREKKTKEKETQKTEISKSWTRNDEHKKQEMQKKWREDKQRQRQNLSSQKKRRINEKRRKKYQEKKQTLTIKLQKPTVKDSSSHVDERSAVAKRKSLSRARAAIPKSPIKYVNTVIDLIEKSTPKKRKTFEELGLSVKSKKSRLFEDTALNAVKETLNLLKGSKSEEDRKRRRIIVGAFSVMRRYRLGRKTSKAFGISTSFLNRYNRENAIERKKRSDALVGEVRSKVETFFEDNATYLPDEKKVLKKYQKSRMIVDKSVEGLYQEFKSENPEIKISLSVFCKLRPKFIQCAKETKYRQCLCEYCTNIELKLRELNKILQNSRQGILKVKDKYALSSLTVCPKPQNESFYKLECLDRTCRTCGVQKIAEHLEPVSDQNNENCIWLRWETKTIPKVKNGKEMKDKNGKTITTTKKVLTEKKSKVSELIEELKQESKPFALHLFHAKWQNEQFKKIRTNPRHGTVVQVLDFAENFTCMFQDEIQAAHWTHELATVHPIVCYYKCEDCEDGIVTESLVYVSDDLKHDHHAVHCFVTMAHQHLTSTRNLPVNHYIQWTDGCASQYKSKIPFKDISYSIEEYGCTMERNFFGSRHGKGPSDGESAVIKREARSYVKRRKCVIRGARNLYEYCRDNLVREKKSSGCTHFRRSVFWIDSQNINRNRPERMAATVKGTRSLHCVRSIETGTIQTRRLSCYCEACVNGTGVCSNIGFVDNWSMERMKQTRAQLALNENQGDHQVNDQQVDQGSNQTEQVDHTDNQADEHVDQRENLEQDGQIATLTEDDLRDNIPMNTEDSFDESFQLSPSTVETLLDVLTKDDVTPVVTERFSILMKIKMKFCCGTWWKPIHIKMDTSGLQRRMSVGNMSRLLFNTLISLILI